MIELVDVKLSIAWVKSVINRENTTGVNFRISGHEHELCSQNKTVFFFSMDKSLQVAHVVILTLLQL